jgi:hypothetical protein
MAEDPGHLGSTRSFETTQGHLRSRDHKKGYTVYSDLLEGTSLSPTAAWSMRAATDGLENVGPTEGSVSQ